MFVEKFIIVYNKLAIIYSHISNMQLIDVIIRCDRVI